MEKLPRVAPIRDETKYMIKRKSAYTLPNNPSREGMKPADIKRALWGPVVDTANSLVAELERVITEINAFIQSTESEIGGAEGIVTKAEKIRNDIVALAGRAATAAEHATVAREKSESAAVESLYYSELSRKAMENQEGSRAFVVDTMEALLSFARTGKALLYRVVDGMRVPYSPKDLETGDTIYVKELDVPDFWWIKTDTAEGAFVYEGETLAYPMAESHTIAERMAEIDAVIAEQSAALQTGETVVNTDGDALVPDYDWYLYGVGSEEEPYRIGSPAALLALSNLSNGLYDPAVLGEDEATIHYFDGKYFMQTANIDMGGTGFMPISFEERESYDSTTSVDNYDNLFYDGRGHYIANFVQSGYRVGGIFGNVGGGGYIRNLHLKNVHITANADAGGIAGVIMAGMDVINCSVDSDSTITSLCILNGETMQGNAGGIAGYFTLGDSESQKSVVRGCVNAATVKSAARAGGLFASVKEGAVSIFEYCVNRGTVEVDGSHRTAIGGIIAWWLKESISSPHTSAVFCHCYNTGSLFANTTSSYLFMGGIAGDVRGNAGTTLTLEYCYDNSSRRYAKGGGAIMNHALVGVYDDAQITKRYAYCHAANVDGSESLYTALGYYMNKSNVTVESCSITSDVDIYVTDTYPEIILQLHPLENYFLGDIDTALDAIIAIQEALLGGDGV